MSAKRTIQLFKEVVRFSQQAPGLYQTIKHVYDTHKPDRRHLG